MGVCVGGVLFVRVFGWTCVLGALPCMGGGWEGGDASVYYFVCSPCLRANNFGKGCPQSDSTVDFGRSCIYGSDYK